MKTLASLTAIFGLLILVGCLVTLGFLFVDYSKQDNREVVAQAPRQLTLTDPTRVLVTYSPKDQDRIGNKRGLFVCIDETEVLFFAEATRYGAALETSRQSYMRSIPVRIAKEPLGNPRCYSEFTGIKINEFTVSERPL